MVKEGDAVFVGVLRSAKCSGGGSLVNVAAIHEFGLRPIVLKITPKVRALLHAAFRQAGLEQPSGDRQSKSVAVIRIPHGRSCGRCSRNTARPTRSRSCSWTA